MIGFLRGTVAYLLSDICLLDVNGVGYRVYIAGNTHQQLHLGEEAPCLPIRRLGRMPFSFMAFILRRNMICFSFCLQ